MINEEQYNKQLITLETKLSNLPHLKNLQLITLPITSKSIITFQTTPNDSITQSFMIRYNDNYQSPILYFKIMKLELVSQDFLEFESWKPIINPDQIKELTNQDQYQFGMTQVEDTRGTWWFIHPCDTTEILQNSTNEEFLINWFSVFGGLFINFKIDDLLK